MHTEMLVLRVLQELSKFYLRILVMPNGYVVNDFYQSGTAEIQIQGETIVIKTRYEREVTCHFSEFLQTLIDENLHWYHASKGKTGTWDEIAEPWRRIMNHYDRTGDINAEGKREPEPESEPVV